MVRGLSSAYRMCSSLSDGLSNGFSGCSRNNSAVIQPVPVSSAMEMKIIHGKRLPSDGAGHLTWTNSAIYRVKKLSASIDYLVDILLA